MADQTKNAFSKIHHSSVSFLVNPTFFSSPFDSLNKTKKKDFPTPKTNLTNEAVLVYFLVPPTLIAPLPSDEAVELLTVVQAHGLRFLLEPVVSVQLAQVGQV